MVASTHFLLCPNRAFTTLGVEDKSVTFETAGESENMLWTGEDYLIEGEAILPESARRVLDSNSENVAACFLGYAAIEVEKKVEETKAHSSGNRDWLMNESDEAIHRHIENMVEYSRKVQTQCDQHNVPYFDTSTNFLATVERAKEHLFTAR